MVMLLFVRLERQRTLLDDELVATKEELLFIRAQLQVRSHKQYNRNVSIRLRH